MTVQHLVLTRFNLVFKSSPQFSADRRGLPTRTPEWLTHRFSLFEKYCLPSLQHQTNQDFSWLVFFDQDTPKVAKERVIAHAQAFPKLIPVFLPPVDSDADLQKACEKHIRKDAQMLITTRLDNDDGFHEKAIETLQHHVEDKGRYLVSFRFGFNLRDGQARVIRHRFNPFISLFEKPVDGKFLTVFCGLPHGKLSKIALVRTIADRPYWLQVIHERNIANRGAGEKASFNSFSLKGCFKKFKHGVLKPCSRLFWPAEFKRAYSEQELRAMFHFR